MFSVGAALQALSAAAGTGHTYDADTHVNAYNPGAYWTPAALAQNAKQRSMMPRGGVPARPPGSAPYTVAGQMGAGENAFMLGAGGAPSRGYSDVNAAPGSQPRSGTPNPSGSLRFLTQPTRAGGMRPVARGGGYGGG